METAAPYNMLLFQMVIKVGSQSVYSVNFITNKISEAQSASQNGFFFLFIYFFLLVKQVTLFAFW